MRNLSDQAKKNKQLYNNKYDKEHYVRVALNLRPEEAEAVKAHATAQGESVNAFIARAIKQAIEADNAESVNE